MEGLWQVYTITGSLQKRPFFILGGKKQCSITLDPSIKKPALISLNIKRLGFFQDIIESLAFFPLFFAFMHTTGSLRSIIPKRCSPSRRPHCI